MTDGEREIHAEQEKDARECEESMPIAVELVEAGDLEYKVWVPDGAATYNGRWERREFPRSMLLQFASEGDMQRFMCGDRIELTYSDP